MGRGRPTATPLPPRPARNAGPEPRRDPRAGSRRGRGRTPRTPGAGGAPSAAERRGRPPSPRRPPSGPAPQLAGAPRLLPRPPPRAPSRRRHHRAPAGAAGHPRGSATRSLPPPGGGGRVRRGAAAPPLGAGGRRWQRGGCRQKEPRSPEWGCLAGRQTPRAAAAAADSVSLGATELLSSSGKPRGWGRDKCREIRSCPKAPPLLWIIQIEARPGTAVPDSNRLSGALRPPSHDQPISAPFVASSPERRVRPGCFLYCCSAPRNLTTREAELLTLGHTLMRGRARISSQ